MSRALPRRQARTRALELLFAADVRDVPVADVVASTPWVDAFTRTLVDAVEAHRADLDALIERQAEGWSLSRMPVVDRNLLRLGLAELLHVEDVPAAVAIDEAVELAKELSTDESPRFINGVLAAIARDRELL